jgi:hypothetical protein
VFDDLGWGVVVEVGSGCCFVYVGGIVDFEWVSEWVIERVSEWASEWLLFNTNSAIFQLYHAGNMLIFNDKMMKSALN